VATGSERQAALRQRRTEEGLQRIELWVPPEAVERVKAYAARVSKKRGQVLPEEPKPVPVSEKLIEDKLRTIFDETRKNGRSRKAAIETACESVKGELLSQGERLDAFTRVVEQIRW
jgi:hypothetical protein